MGMPAACLLLELIGGSSLVESCSRGKREQAEKVVAVEASKREGRLRDFADIIARYISHLLSINKDTLQEDIICVASFWAENNGRILLLYWRQRR